MIIKVSFFNIKPLKISFVYTIVVQLISIVFLSFFSSAILTFEEILSLYKFKTSLGGYSKEGVIIYFELLKKIIFFLLALNIVAFFFTIILLIIFYISTWQGNKVNRLVCYIFAIFSFITTLFGGLLFLFWFAKAKK